MKNKNILKGIISFSLLMFFFKIDIVNAGSATIAVSASSSKINVGDAVNITIGLKNIVGAEPGVAGFQGTLSYDKTILNCTKGTKISPEDGFRVSYNVSTNKMTGFAGDASEKIPGSAFSFVRVSCTALKEGTTSITVNNHEVSAGDASVMSTNSETATVEVVTVKNPEPEVPKDPEPSKPTNPTTPSGGNEENNSGNSGNSSGGSSGTNTIAPNNPSNSGNNNVPNNSNNQTTNNNEANLSSLKIEGVNLNFRSNITNYELRIPYSMSDLKITAVPQNKKAKVTISNQNNIAVGETREVSIKVVDNNITKTYIIKVTRESDESIVLSENNYLASINPSVGILSPVFNKEKTNYFIYLPYEVEQLEISSSLEDNKATLDIEGPENLKVGNNKFYLKVTSESGKELVYTINVIRARNPEDSGDNKPLLKNIIIKGGSLTKKFQKDSFVYEYEKKKGFQLDPELEDTNNHIDIFHNDDVINILVTDDFGNANIYTLIPKKEIIKSSPTLYIIISAIISFTSLFIGYIGGAKKVLAKLVRRIRLKKINNQ